jgi:succinoglycan biosynthesis protein ExoM
MDVSVSICTYRRVFVWNTITSILAQVGLDKIRWEIVVCDDDPERSAQALIERAAAASPISIRYLSSGTSNVSVARNTCLEEARGRFVAFVDDDETCEPDWLSQLMHVQSKFGADVVKGFVRGRYPTDTPLWIRAGDPFTRDCGHTGTRIETMGTGNVLFNRSFAINNRIRFDPQKGPTGGEDTDFFRRMNECGARMIACREAIVNEVVPDDRVTQAYIRRRFRHFGRMHGSDGVARHLRAQTACGFVKALARISLLWPFMLKVFERSPAFFQRTYFRGFSNFWYNIGILEAMTFGRGSGRHS